MLACSSSVSVALVSLSHRGKRGSTVLDGVNFHSAHVALLLPILAAVKKSFLFLGAREGETLIYCLPPEPRAQFENPYYLAYLSFLGLDSTVLAAGLARRLLIRGRVIGIGIGSSDEPLVDLVGACVCESGMLGDAIVARCVIHCLPGCQI